MQRKQQRPTAIFSVCAPSDIQGLERWEAHLHPLERAGSLSIRSVRHLQPGANRLKLLQDHLDQADFIILLLSIDFFTNDECCSLMKRALARHQQGTTRLIPLLLCPFAFRETELATFTPFPSDGRPVTLWENTEAAFDDCVRGLRRILGRPVTKPLVGKSKRPSVEEQNRARMLQRLRRTYEELFTQSLAGVTQIELGMASKADAVQNAATLLLQTATRPAQLLPLGTSILDVYDKAMHELLILGAPGAGKSVLLVELAQQLVRRAAVDDIHPLPAILPLSSWAVKRPSLHLWLVEQVAHIYDIPKNIAEHWIEKDQLLPLLDGLDEMEEGARLACIAAINAYHHDHLRLPLVVCSRQTEYEQASKSQRLSLQNAVVVQSLTREHVQTFLKQAGKPLITTVLTTNQALAEIATTPLMVYILVLTYQGTSVQQLPTQHKQLQQQIWTDYLTHMVARKGDSKRYPLKQTQAWLSYLAQQIREHNQTTFYLEHLQPDWLAERDLRSYKAGAVHLPAIVIGILISLFVSLFLFGLTDLTFIFQSSLLGGFLGELWSSVLPPPRVQIAETRTFRRRWRICFITSAFIGLLFGLSFGFNVAPGYSLNDWLFDGLLKGTLIMLGCILLQFLSEIVSRRTRVAPTSTSNQQLRQRLLRFWHTSHVQHAWLVVVVFGLIFGLDSLLSLGLKLGLSNTLSFALSLGLSRGLSRGLSWGLISILVSLTVVQAGTIRLTERLKWTWRSLKRSLLIPGHLRITLFLTFLIMILIGLRGLSDGLSFGTNSGLTLEVSSGLKTVQELGMSTGLSNSLSIGLKRMLSEGLSTGLSLGLSYWLLFGLLRGIAQEQIEDRDRRVVNQGIRDSLRNGVIMGIISVGIVEIINLLANVLSTGLSNVLSVGLSFGPSNILSPEPSLTTSLELNFGLSNALNSALLIGVSSGLLMFIISGGLAAVCHYIIRLLFWHSHTFPWKTQPFLDNAVTCILLRRVGGGYSFVHRLLMDYFADLPAEPNSTSTTHSRNFPPANNPSA